MPFEPDKPAKHDIYVVMLQNCDYAPPPGISLSAPYHALFVIRAYLGRFYTMVARLITRTTATLVLIRFCLLD